MSGRITFRDDSGKLVWFDPEKSTHCYVDLPPGKFPSVENLVRLPNAVWVKYDEPLLECTLTNGTVLNDEQALDWLLTRGYDPPSELDRILETKDLATNSLRKEGDKVRLPREIVHDKNDPNKWFVLETSRADEWKLEGFGEEWDVDGSWNYWVEQTVYRQPSGLWVLVEERIFLELGIRLGKSFRTIGEVEAAELLLTNGYVLPEELATLVKHRELTLENAPKPSSNSREVQESVMKQQAQTLAYTPKLDLDDSFLQNGQDNRAERILSIEQAPDADPFPDPLQEESLVTAVAKPRVVLRSREQGPLILGRTKRRLTRAQYDVVKAALNAPDGGWTKDQLVAGSGHEDALGVLRRLAEKDPDWELVIHFAGQTGGGYWIK